MDGVRALLDTCGSVSLNVLSNSGEPENLEPVGGTSHGEASV